MQSTTRVQPHSITSITSNDLHLEPQIYTRDPRTWASLIPVARDDCEHICFALVCVASKNPEDPQIELHGWWRRYMGQYRRSGISRIIFVTCTHIFPVECPSQQCAVSPVYHRNKQWHHIQFLKWDEIYNSLSSFKSNILNINSILEL